MAPAAGLQRDNNVRADASLEKLATLRPVFDTSGSGTLTAGNRTPLTDGAAAVLLASEEWARERRLPILAYLRAGKSRAVDFASGKEGLLMAPAYAVSAMLEDVQLTLQDFDYYEIHEAFAAQMLCTLRAWESPEILPRAARPQFRAGLDYSRQDQRQGRERGARPPVCGHRRAHSRGARQGAARGRPGRGAITICAAAGQGVVAILEAPGKDGK